MAFVLDASVSAAWSLADEHSDYAEQVLALLDSEEALVPSVWWLEMANSLLTAERRGRVSTAEVLAAGTLLLTLRIRVADASARDVLGPVLELARAQGLTTYDASYLNLAMREGVPLATQDEALERAAARVGVPLVGR